MSHWKIGIVYGDHNPEILESFASEGVPWGLEFFHESSVLQPPVPARPDFLAVFFPLDDAYPENARSLSRIFPGAEVIGYANAAGELAAAARRREDGTLVVPYPPTYAYARSLLENLAATRAAQAEILVTRRRSEELEEFFAAFIDMVECSLSPEDRKLGVRLLIHKVLGHLDAEECVIYLLDRAGKGLQRAYTTGNLQNLDLFDQHANGSIVDNVLDTGAACVNNHYSLELRMPFQGEGIAVRSILAYPLERRGEKIGVIEILNKKGSGFTSEDQRFLESMLHPIGVAMRTLHLFEESERLTVTDDLTGLYNYRYLMQFLESEVKRCLRYRKNLSLLFIDVDGFKRINDTFGHLVGSQALAEMGQVFRGIVRDTDVVGRYGGDEFVIALPETPLTGAMVIAERIRKKIEDYEFAAQNLNIRMTVSLGVASCPRHTLTAEGLIKKADGAMYRAKEISKNSIKMAV